MRLKTVTAELADPNTRSWWILSLPMMSLDRVRSFWEPMGLHFAHPAPVLEAIRRFVLAEECLPGNPQTRTYGRKVLTLTRAMFKDLREAEGGRAQGDRSVLDLWNWFQVGCDEEPKWHWMWRILMYHLPSTALETWGIPKEKARKVLALAEAFADSVREVEAHVQRLQAQPLSSWDAFQYQYFQQDGSGWDPLCTFAEAMERIQFDRSWAQVVALLSLAEMEHLVRWGRTHAAWIESEKDEESRKTDEILGPRALQARDAIIPAEWRTFN